MAFYIISIVGADILILIINLLVNKHFFNMPIWYICVASISAAVIVIAIDGLTAWLVRRLPEPWFTADKKIWDVSKKECTVYEKIGIKNWKDKVIELGIFTNFSKKTIADPKSLEYIERFIMESNFGAVIHIVNIICAYAVIFCYPLKYWLCFGFPAACVNAFLSILPFFILRYNNNRLLRLRAILIKKATKATEEK